MATSRSLRVAVLVCVLVSTLHVPTSLAFTTEKGRITDCSTWTRARDCSPWGLTGDKINPAFQYDYPDGPLNHCNGVINTFYYFKIINFGQDLETSVLLRALKGVSEVLWNSWAHYHPTATDTLGMLTKNPKRRAPAKERNIVNKNIAIAYALARITKSILPSAAREAQDVLVTLVSGHGDLTGYETTTDPSTPQGIGNLVAKELSAYLKDDGWNSEGEMSPRKPYPFGDYTNYIPKNTVDKVTLPTRWQPLMETDKQGYYVVQQHTTPHVRNPLVKTWALNRSWVDERQLPLPWDPETQGANFYKWYKGNVSAVLNASANLSTTQKLVTEFFDSKVVSFGGFERWFAWKKNWCQDDFVMYDQLSACLHDATILTWKEKIRIDAIRPASAIRFLADIGQLPKTVKAWGGAKSNYTTTDVNPYSWTSYMRTMPHSEFPSGTSCVCQVWAEWTKLFQNGDDTLDLPLTWEQGCSSVEKDVTPASRFTHKFPTISGALSTCLKSRIWAGVHFESSLQGGADLCSGVAQKCYDKVQRLLKGNPN